MNRSRIIWIAFAVIAFSIFLPVSISLYRDYEVYSEGGVVDVTVTYLPDPLTSKSEFMKFEMGGNIYDKRVNRNTSSVLHIGEKIQLKYLEQYKGHFLFPKEDPIGWGVCALAMLLFVGLSCIYYACQKNPPSIGGPSRS